MITPNLAMQLTIKVCICAVTFATSLVCRCQRKKIEEKLKRIGSAVKLIHSIAWILMSKYFRTDPLPISFAYNTNLILNDDNDIVTMM